MDTTVHDLLYAIDKVDDLLNSLTPFIDSPEPNEFDILHETLCDKKAWMEWIVRDQYEFILEKDDLINQ